ncbi:beta-phosphoglucomutase family hydrolase [Vibrio agarivorans]|uniref:Beta-phosphoglucomutase family hydrolase n=1 Tax=Vibrio agarivorans TaxID=153622 RepID=A0ABT7Y5K1_9VIBR|nr:beta-phosphoglucomutase family hydrolase [Vibrio agarivorans]MDN2483230.1 beta-phosphoglucomutase family hydrolase [Vibrio agarivorans]
MSSIYKELEKYQGLIFDMDGTLLDTMPAHLEAWGETAKAFNFEFDQAWFHSLGGMPSPKIVMEINKTQKLTLDPKTVSGFKMDCFRAIKDKGTPIKVTLDIVNALHGKRPLAIGTGSQRINADALVSAAGLEHLFETVVTANDVERHKPNPDTFILAAQNLNCEPARCVVFEDTELGKQAAHAAGMDCYMVEGERVSFHPAP